MRRVVITGMGVVSPLGCSLSSTWERLHKFENAVQTLPELEKYKGLNAHLASPAMKFEMPTHYTRKVLRSMGPVSILALYSAEQAIKQAGLENNDCITNGRTGVAYGSSFGSIEPINDFFGMLKNNEIGSFNLSTYIKIMPHTAGVNLSLYFKTTGRFIPTGTACTSGSLAIGYAYEAIKSGSQDVMIAGGAEEFSPTQIAVFDTLFATSIKNNTPNKTPSPFDKNRDGLVIGEGAGTLILEEYEHAKARGAKIIAEIVGFGTNTDGTHITHPNSITMAKCMGLALDSAGLKESQIGYINAHGTATKQGDIAETIATEAIFGNKTPISSLKSYTGHTLGACGALETIWATEMMNNNWFTPTLNLDTPDDECGKLDYIMGEARTIDTEYIITNNFAFGGINTSIILKKVKGN